MMNFNLLDANAGNPGSMITMVLLYVAIFGALYFFMIRPNSKRKKEEAELRNNVEIGDDITTIGGIVGRIVSVKDEDDTIVIETSTDRTRLKMKKWAISTVDKELPQKAEPEKKGLFGFKKKTDEEAK